MAIYTINNLPEEIDFEGARGSETKRTLQNCKNLLLTKMGEIPYDRYRGLDHSLFDLPLQELRQRITPEMDRVMLWEPDAEVVDAAADLVNGETVITVRLEVDLA